jgi:hypothetical protein
VEESTPQERFNQLLSFLKDPQTHPHPTITIKKFTWLLGMPPNTEIWQEFRQGAIDILESGMIQQGYLKGNKRTPDIFIPRLENFVLNAAGVFQIAKWVIAKSPEAHNHLFDFPPRQLRNDLFKEWRNFHNVFDRLTFRIYQYADIRFDRIRTITNSLIQLEVDCYSNAREPEMNFDMVNEFIFTFLKHIPEAPDNLIASHIFTFISKRQDSTLKGVCLPDRSAICKRVKKLRKPIIKPTI